eukprot:CAMPEP_0116849248 /NCGR_PEP_ID=MMETSP0418-20121206/15463_1 /TAXON_ID=1158023 /ORGANISM="Astrosyne radiata, Strain 13vi08-1A" /LENGTH=213 /DNA_ID=CAMNT_0004480941 /DNA_START=75 /DNA_END=716 /DNA_ORIENTATION=+
MTKLKATTCFNQYFGIMDEPRQAPYLCSKIEQEEHQIELQKDHILNIGRAMKRQASKIVKEKAIMEDDLMSQLAALEAQITKLRRRYEATVQGQLVEIEALGGSDEGSIDLETVESDDEESEADSSECSGTSLNLSLVLDGLTSSFFSLPRIGPYDGVTEKEDDSTTISISKIIHMQFCSKQQKVKPLPRIQSMASNMPKKENAIISRREMIE